MINFRDHPEVFISLELYVVTRFVPNGREGFSLTMVQSLYHQRFYNKTRR